VDLRGYQAEAVAAIVAELAAGGRAQARMACGTGKTLVAASVAARLASGGITIVLAPSIALVAQTIEAWGAGCPADHVLAVCSDQTAGSGGVSLAGLAAPVSTDAEFIAKWIAGTAGRALIAGTYDSAARIAEGMRIGGQEAELAVCDEAHHLAGAAGKPTAAVLRPGFLPTRRLLFLTATPRIVTGVQASGELAVASMDDEALFGRPVFAYPAGQAISDGWLKDYRLVVAAVDDASVAGLLEDSGSQAGEGGVPLSMAAAQAALGMAVAELGLRRCVAFLPTVEASRLFARTLPATLAMLPPGRRPAGPVSAGFVHGKMSTAQRQIALARLRRPPDGGWSVVANARCLGEGVDIPNIDSVLFAAPKDSVTDIVQAAGRPLRLSSEASTAAIIVPAVLAGDEDARAGRWENVVRVVRALAAHDDRLTATLTAVRASRPASGDDGDRESALPASIMVQAAPGAAARLVDALRVRIINATTSTWHDWHALLRGYHREHATADVPHDYQAPGGQRLGRWLAWQRSEHARGTLAADRVTALEELGVTWSLHEAAFQRGLDYLDAYIAAHGHARVPSAYTAPDGYRLGRWLARTRWRRGSPGPQYAPLTANEIAALDARGVTWQPFAASFPEGLEHLDAYITAHGHARVPSSYIVPDGYRLGGWLARMRRRRNNPGPCYPPLTADEITALDERGIEWKPGVPPGSDAPARVPIALPWGDWHALLREYHREHGHADVPGSYLTPGGQRLGQWLAAQRSEHARGDLAASRVAALEELGVSWNLREAAFQRGLQHLDAYIAANGHARVPQSYTTSDGFALGSWIATLRRRQDRLPAASKAALDARGMIWQPLAASFTEGLAHLDAYIAANGHPRVPQSCTAPDGYRLGAWLTRMRQRHNNPGPGRGPLTADETAALDKRGIDWNPGASRPAGGLPSASHSEGGTHE
jgi:superfamily II DNA or RNA helicase